MDWLKEILGEDLFAQVQEALKDKKDVKLANIATGEYVSKAKYENEIATRDSKITELSEKVQNFDGKDMKALQNEVADWKKKYTKDISQMKLENAIDMAVASAHSLSDKALKGLLDLDKLTLDDKGNLKGFDEQLESIKKDNAFMFGEEQKQKKEVNLDGGHNHSVEHKEDTLESAIDEFYNK